MKSIYTHTHMQHKGILLSDIQLYYYKLFYSTKVKLRHLLSFYETTL